MSNETEKLLSVEQAIQQLLTELEALKVQVGGYDHAKHSLEEVREELGRLVERTSTLSERAQSAIAVLAKIGTPEILARVDNTKLVLNQGLDAVTNTVVSQCQELHERTAEIRQASDAGRKANTRFHLISIVLTSLSVLGVVGIVVMMYLNKST